MGARESCAAGSRPAGGAGRWRPRLGHAGPAAAGTEGPTGVFGAEGPTGGFGGNTHSPISPDAFALPPWSNRYGGLVMKTSIL